MSAFKGLWMLFFVGTNICMSNDYLLTNKSNDSIRYACTEKQDSLFHNYKEIISGIEIEMIAVNGGEFNMGSNENDNEQPIHVVELNDFYIGKFEIKQEIWIAIMGFNMSKFAGDELPVEQVSYEEVQHFIEKLNIITGKDYRLPTEAEWEYVARANTSTPFYNGTCLSTDQANYNGNYPYKDCPKGLYRKRQMPVGSFEPNAWGVYDMHGNVWEWCSDWYSEKYYTDSPSVNPKGPEFGKYKVIRGGSWGYFAAGCRSANRGFYGNTLSFEDIGFRLAHDR